MALRFMRACGCSLLLVACGSHLPADPAADASPVGDAVTLPDAAIPISCGSGPEGPGGEHDPSYSGVPAPLDGSSGSVVLPLLDGSVLAIGGGRVGPEIGLLFTRLLPDGSPDPSFGNAGSVLSFDYHDSWDAVLVPDGRIYVLTTRWGSTGTGIAGFLSDGTIDPTFADAGWLDLWTPMYFAPRKLAVQGSGLVVLGFFAQPEPHDEFSLLRLLADGSLDGSFGGGGVVSSSVSRATRIQPLDLAIDESGHVWAFLTATGLDGGQHSALAALRFHSDGTPDTTYGVGGQAVVDTFPYYASTTGATIDCGGRAIFGGAYQPESGLPRLGAFRLTPAGTIDHTFGFNGLASAEPENFYSPADVAVAPDGSILVAADVGITTSYQPVVMRFFESGDVDVDFGASGLAIGTSGHFDSLSVATDGMIYTAGYTWSFSTPTGGPGVMQVQRFLP
jgi:uncharacterized delta-60 repeat protein